MIMKQKRLVLAAVAITMAILFMLTGCENVLEKQTPVTELNELEQNNSSLAAYGSDTITLNARQNVTIRETNRDYYYTFNLPQDSYLINSEDIIVGVEYSFRINSYDQTGISESFSLCYEDSSGITTKSWPITRSFQIGSSISDYTSRFNECKASKLYFRFKLVSSGSKTLSTPVTISDITIKVDIRPAGMVSVIDEPGYEMPVGPSGYPETKIALKARYNNKYFCADYNKNPEAPLYASSNNIGSRERFYMVQLGGGKVAFRSEATGKYVTAKDFGYSQAVANGTTIGELQTFDYETISYISNGVKFKNNIIKRWFFGPVLSKYSGWYLRFDGGMQQYQGTGCIFYIEYLY